MKLRESGGEAFKITTNTNEQKGHQYIGQWKGGGVDIEYLWGKETCEKKSTRRVTNLLL